MTRISFLCMFLSCVIATAIACSSHKSRKHDDDVVAPDELIDDVLIDEETFDEGETEDLVPVDDSSPHDEDLLPDGDDADILPDADMDSDTDMDADTDGEHPANPINVPYFCQFKNTQDPDSTSGNTSLAMLLYLYGWVGTPDDLTSAWGKDKAQTPNGLAEIFNSYSETTGMTLSSHLNGTFGEIKALIDQGKPVIAHTWFTPAGHVIIINGYTEGGYFTNDPAGVWDLTYKGGFSLTCDQAVVGKSEFYPASPFEAALGPDGEVRYHEPVPAE